MQRILAVMILIISTACNPSAKKDEVVDKSLQADIKRMYLFKPPAGSSSSDMPLPQKVDEAKNGRLLIIGGFYRLTNPNMLMDMSVGTGFRVSENIILSAKHILFSPIIRRSLPFVIDHNGVPQGINYTYIFMGIEFTSAGPKEIPISLIAIGELNQYQDFMAFKIMGNTQLKILKMQDKVEERQDIYTSGFVPKESPIIGTGGRLEPVLSDLLDYTFKGRVSAKITDLPINKRGIMEYYRAKVAAEHGFSGGPAFNKDGEVVGMTIEGSQQFTYIVSAKDLINFVDKIKKQGLDK